MKKILLFSMMILLLGACTSTKEADDMSMMSRGNTDNEWWQEAGNPDSEYWWISGYGEDTESDSE